MALDFRAAQAGMQYPMQFANIFLQQELQKDKEKRDQEQWAKRFQMKQKAEYTPFPKQFAPDIEKPENVIPAQGIGPLPEPEPVDTKGFMDVKFKDVTPELLKEVNKFVPGIGRKQASALVKAIKQKEGEAKIKQDYPSPFVETTKDQIGIQRDNLVLSQRKQKLAEDKFAAESLEPTPPKKFRKTLSDAELKLYDDVIKEEVKGEKESGLRKPPEYAEEIAKATIGKHEENLTKEQVDKKWSSARTANEKKQKYRDLLSAGVPRDVAQEWVRKFSDWRFVQ